MAEGLVPDGITTCLFDLDGVLTQTAKIHAQAWKSMFDDFLRDWAERHDERFQEFDRPTDYDEYVDGKPRLEGVHSFLQSRGIDLPEVSLVAILDADKEGFLRGETSLIQTIGRAARNVGGTVLMYADKETEAMRRALAETDRRRAIQVAYNEEHGITATTISKGISDIAEFLQSEGKTPRGKRRTARKRVKAEEMSLSDLERTIVELEEEMLAAAEDLRFEYAARLRDELRDLRRDMSDLEQAQL